MRLLEMEARLDAALGEADAIVDRLPGGETALLERAVLLVCDGPSLLPTLLACHGARVTAVGTGMPGPSELEALRTRLAEGRPHLDPEPLTGSGVEQRDDLPPDGAFDVVVVLGDAEPDWPRLFELGVPGGLALHAGDAAPAGFEPLGTEAGWMLLRRRRGVNTEYPTEADSEQTLAHTRARYALAERFVEGRRVLDVGSGAGLGTRQLAAAGAALAVGVELRPEALALAAGVPGVRADAQGRLPFADASFDVVVALEVLEHVEAQQALIDEVRRVLAPDGVALISIPNPPYEHLWTKLHGESNPYHVRVPYYDEFVTLLSGFGWVDLYGQVDLVASVVLPLDDRARGRTVGGVHLPAATALSDHGTSAILAVCRAERPPVGDEPPRAWSFGDYQDDMQGAVVARMQIEERLRAEAWRRFTLENRAKWEG